MTVMLNLAVYVLLFGPLALLLRGYGVTPLRHVWLATLLVAVQLLELLLLESLPTALPLRAMARVLLLPVIDACVFDFVLGDAKAQKPLGLHDIVAAADDDDKAATAVVTVLWCLCDTVLTRWFAWYRSLSSPGFELANVRRAADAFALLLATRTACRYLRSNNNNNNNNINNNNGSRHAVASSSTAIDALSSRAVVVVVAARVLTALVSHAVTRQLPPLPAALLGSGGAASGESGGSTSNGLLANALAAAVLTVALHTRRAQTTTTTATKQAQ